MAEFKPTPEQQEQAAAEFQRLMTLFLEYQAQNPTRDPAILGARMQSIATIAAAQVRAFWLLVDPERLDEAWETISQQAWEQAELIQDIWRQKFGGN